MNRVSEKRDSGKTLEDVKALIDGLPSGLVLAERLAIFKKNFSVAKRGFKDHGGPTDDCLLKATRGDNRPTDSTMENLCQSATKALMAKHPGLLKRDAARAGKWLADGPIRIAVPSESPELPDPKEVAGQDVVGPSEEGLREAIATCNQDIAASARAKKPWNQLGQAVGLVKRYLEDMEWLQRPPNKHPIVLGENGQPMATVGYFKTPKMIVNGKRPAQTVAPVPFPYSANGFDAIERELHSMLFSLNRLCKGLPGSKKRYRFLRIDVRHIGRLHGQLAGPYRRQSLAEDLSRFDPLPMIDDGGIDKAVNAVFEALADEKGLLETARQMGLIPLEVEAL
ncbi:MAG: hypothetical protein KIS61_09280 [Candidatus Eremiobacteraeota bacterium]|nr:hypothetical protein [Candidatus Eremiobacteraeota bacterium]